MMRRGAIDCNEVLWSDLHASLRVLKETYLHLTEKREDQILDITIYTIADKENNTGG